MKRKTAPPGLGAAWAVTPLRTMAKTTAAVPSLNRL